MNWTASIGLPSGLRLNAIYKMPLAAAAGGAVAAVIAVTVLVVVTGDITGDVIVDVIADVIGDVAAALAASTAAAGSSMYSINSAGLFRSWSITNSNPGGTYA